MKMKITKRRVIEYVLILFVLDLVVYFVFMDEKGVRGWIVSTIIVGVLFGVIPLLSHLLLKLTNDGQKDEGK